ncbi:MAG: outer membrane beta-barrel protein [Bacteroidota bacterium]
MFKVTFLLLATLLTTSELLSQIQYGIKGSALYVSNVDNFEEILGQTPLVVPEYRISYQLGVFGSYPLGKNLSANAEFLYSHKGFKAEGQPGGIPEGDATVHLHYLNLPLLLGYKPLGRLQVMVGPELGYLLSAKSKFESETLDVGNVWDERFELAITGGIRYELISQLYFDVRYSHGLTSVTGSTILTDPSGNSLEEELTNKNRAWAVGLAYQMP